MSGARVGLAAAQKVTDSFAKLSFEEYLKFISGIHVFLAFTFHVCV